MRSMTLDEHLSIITRIQEVDSAEWANELLANDWRLLSIRERTRASTDSFNRPYLYTTPVYIFGWTRPLPSDQQTIAKQEEGAR